MKPEEPRPERPRDLLEYERGFWGRGRCVAGVDEAGRGPLAGPVVAAAVIVSPEFFLPAVNDSKELTAGQREALYDEIVSGADAVGIGEADNCVIDRINILRAT